MKRIFLFLILMSVCSMVSIAQESTLIFKTPSDISTVNELIKEYPRSDSAYRWRWDTLLEQWHLSYRQYMQFNSNDDLTEQITQILTDSGWINSGKFTLVYDQSFNNIYGVSQQWNDNAWENWMCGISNYDVNNNRLSRLSKYWNDTVWINTTQNIYTYDSINRLTHELFQQWMDEYWSDYSNTSYSFDSNDNLISRLVSYSNGSSVLYTYSYNSNNKLTIEFTQNNTDTTWENSYKRSYTYDADNNLTYSIGQNWNDSTWKDDVQFIYTYDANNNKLTYQHQRWTDSIWKDSYSSLFTYYSNNSLESQVIWIWDFSDTIIDSGDSIRHYFHSLADLNENSTEKDILIFPIPSSNYIELILPNESAIEILNLNGQIIRSLNAAEGSSVIDISDLSSGVYLLKLYTDKFTAVKKIIKQ